MTYLDQAFEDQKWQVVHGESSFSSKEVNRTSRTYNIFRYQPLLLPSILWVIFTSWIRIPYKQVFPDLIRIRNAPHQTTRARGISSRQKN
jgi:hypothetical protein